jgi:hypothetical protein
MAENVILGEDIVHRDEIERLITICKTEIFTGQSIFNDKDDSYYRGIIEKMKVEVARGIGTCITKMGRIGRKLYIIQEGTVAVMDEKDENLTKIELGPGNSK